MAAEGLKRILNIPHFWSKKPQQQQVNMLSRILKLFDIWISEPDACMLLQLLQIVAIKDVAQSAAMSKEQLPDFLQVCVNCLSKVIEAELGIIYNNTHFRKVYVTHICLTIISSLLHARIE
jgi:hypothetical protein